MSEFTMAHELHNMVAAPAGVATIQVIYRSEDGILLCYGITKPTDDTAGYAKGCLFLHTDGDEGDMFYINEGDADDCDFDATLVTSDAVITLAMMADESVDSDQYVDGSIDNAHLADECVDSDNYVDASIDLAHMSVESIDSDQYIDGSIDVEHIADTNAVVDDGVPAFGTTAGVGPSPVLWEGEPILDIILDPSKGYYLFEDFNKNLTAAELGGTLTQVTGGGTFTNDPTVAGGVSVLDNAANTANDATTLSFLAMQCKPGVGTHIIFEARVKVGVDDGALFIGLHDDSATDILTATINVNTDHAGFFRDEGTGAAAVGTQACDGSDVTSADDSIADSDISKFEKFGIHIFGDGNTAGDYVKFYHKGVLVATVTDADGGGDDGVPDEVICPTFAVDNVGDTTQSKLSFDWMRILCYNATDGTARA